MTDHDPVLEALALTCTSQGDSMTRAFNALKAHDPAEHDRWRSVLTGELRDENGAPYSLRRVYEALNHRLDAIGYERRVGKDTIARWRNKHSHL
ncbi:MAG: hypothetical protein ACOYOQ_00595 [Microthrixaceae bacterium]